jgi:hypothetical protein
MTFGHLRVRYRTGLISPSGDGSFLAFGCPKLPDRNGQTKPKKLNERQKLGSVEAPLDDGLWVDLSRDAPCKLHAPPPEGLVTPLTSHVTRDLYTDQPVVVFEGGGSGSVGDLGIRID